MSRADRFDRGDFEVRYTRQRPVRTAPAAEPEPAMRPPAQVQVAPAPATAVAVLGQAVRWPIARQQLKRVGESVLADRNGHGRPHKGIDLFAEAGTQVRAASAGEVIRVVDGRHSGREAQRRAGLFVDVRGRGALVFRYLHLGETSVEPVDFAALVHDAAGVGIARRVSETTGIDTLYVAQRVTAANGELVGILRMAMPVERIHTMTNGTMHFARNAQALAVSLAIGFSLLAAILFVRPLQRVSKMVHALAAGDIGAQVGPLGNDEVGDVGRSLEQMALELRRKLLTAGLGEALLSQLVEALATPCMVFEESGTIVAMNGAARRHLRIDGQAAGQRMKEFTEHEAVCAALRTAEYEGEPEPLQVLLPWSVEARGHMHVLKRPGMGPLRVFIGSEPAPEPRMLLPDPTEIQPRTLGPMLEAAATQARGALVSAGVTVQLPGAPPSVLVIDASGRLMGAVATALAGCARGLEGRRETLAVGIVEEPLRIRLELNAVASPETVLEVRKHLEPFGGAIEVLSAETHLWLPRA